MSAQKPGAAPAARKTDAAAAAKKPGGAAAAGVCVVGVGACTPIGATAAISAASARMSLSRMSEYVSLEAKFEEEVFAAQAAFLPERARGLDRLAALALPALQEALAPLAPEAEAKGEGGEKPGAKPAGKARGANKAPAVPLVLALPVPRPGFPADLASGLVAQLEKAAAGVCAIANTQTVAKGHSAGLMALEQGARLIREGKNEWCLVGGVDSYVDDETFRWLIEKKRLLVEGVRGFVPGEAAGFCLLASASAAEARGLAPLANVLGVKVAKETVTFDAGGVCVGKGLSEAVEGALAALPSAQDKVAHTICDVNGERYRAEEWGFTIARHGQRFVNAADFFAPTICWGDVGAASGPLFVALAAAAGQRGYAAGPLTLLWTSSDAGERAAALLQTLDPQ